MGRIRDCRIGQWIAEFAKLYARNDKGRVAEEYWIATMAHCSTIGESIRSGDYQQLMKAAAHTFCWLCCYVNHCNKTDDQLFRINDSLCDIVFLKYPSVCGHCKGNPCNCDAFKTESKKDKGADYKYLLGQWKDQKRTEGHRFSEWLNMFRSIYGGRIHLQTLESLGFHFLEEVGEEAKAVRQLVQLRGAVRRRDIGLDKTFLEEISHIENLVEEYGKCKKDKEGKPKIKMDSMKLEDIKARIVRAKMDLVIELADTFSWFCAILVKVLRITGGIQVKNDLDYDLESYLRKEYKASLKGLKCPTCHKSPCKCLFFTIGSRKRN